MTEEKLVTCKCGHWYNTTIKCPECDTVAYKYHFTTSDKIQLLRYNEYYCVEGICADFEAPDSATNVIISYEEIIKKLKCGVAWWCMEKHGEWFFPLEDAWKSYLDQLYSDINTDKEEDVLAYVKLQLEMMSKDEM